METEILNRFLSTGEELSHRQWMCELQYWDGYAYATDAYFMARMKSDVFSPDSIYKHISLFPDYFEGNKIGEITTSAIKDAMSRFKKHPVYPHCEECLGAGEITCSYGHIHACEDCDGEGILEGENPIGEEYNHLEVLKIHDQHISLNKIDPILDLSENWEILLPTKTQQENATIFKGDNVEIIIMKFLVNNETKLNGLAEVKLKE